MPIHERLWLNYVLGGLMRFSHDNINQNENWPKLVIIKGKQLDYKSKCKTLAVPENRDWRLEFFHLAKKYVCKYQAVQIKIWGFFSKVLETLEA